MGVARASSVVRTDVSKTLAPALNAQRNSSAAMGCALTRASIVRAVLVGPVWMASAWMTHAVASAFVDPYATQRTDCVPGMTAMVLRVRGEPPAWMANAEATSPARTFNVPQGLTASWAPVPTGRLARRRSSVRNPMLLFLYWIVESLTHRAPPTPFTAMYGASLTPRLRAAIPGTPEAVIVAHLLAVQTVRGSGCLLSRRSFDAAGVKNREQAPLISST